MKIGRAIHSFRTRDAGGKSTPTISEQHAVASCTLRNKQRQPRSSNSQLSPNDGGYEPDVFGERHSQSGDRLSHPYRRGIESSRSIGASIIEPGLALQL